MCNNPILDYEMSSWEGKEALLGVTAVHAHKGPAEVQANSGPTAPGLGAGTPGWTEPRPRGANCTCVSSQLCI